MLQTNGNNKQLFCFICSKIPEEWISDDRCFLCKYSKRSSPRLCHCREILDGPNKYSIDARKAGLKNQNNGVPIPPVRTNSLTRGKKKKVLFLSNLNDLLRFKLHLHQTYSCMSNEKLFFQTSNGSHYNDYSLPNRHLRHSRNKEPNG